MDGRAFRRRINFFLFLFLGLNAAFWLGGRDIYAKWSGVPPVPGKSGAVMMTLGDPQFSFRFLALTLQNLGDTGGQTAAVKDYDFQKLGKWFWLLHDLDPASNHVPMLAAYYFSVTTDPANVAVLVDYLGTAGQSPVGEKWRWLAQAVFLARYRMKDLDRALELAYKLAQLEPVDGAMPIWARQMPAFILTAKGEKEGAEHIVLSLLANSRDLDPKEINFMKSFLVERLGLSEKDVEALIKEKAVQGPLE